MHNFFFFLIEVVIRSQMMYIMTTTLISIPFNGIPQWTGLKYEILQKFVTLAGLINGRPTRHLW